MEISTQIRTPFTRRIARVDFPIHFVVLSFENYDGSTDPKEHILRYHNSMVPLGIPEEKKEAMMC